MVKSFSTLLQETSVEYNVSEKELLSWVRSSVRQIWADSPMKRKIEEESTELVENTNTRSMKRFPIVKKRTCAICGNKFSINDVELDHISGQNSIKSFDEAESFIKSILFPNKKDLQWLCIDKFKTEKKKKVLVSFGCHGIKTLSERNGISFQEAAITKEAIKLIKDGLDKQFFIDRNLEIPSNADKRRINIVNILMKELNND